MTSLRIPGLNVQAPWARLLVEGQKTIETRTYPLPSKYHGRDLWIIETPGKQGKFRARVIGIIRFSGFKKYLTKYEFELDERFHLIKPGCAEYAWKGNTPKYGWIVEAVRPTSEFAAPSARGIIYSGPFQRSERS